MNVTTASGPTIRTAAAVGLDELRASDAPAVGGKAAHLGELRGAGFPVPPGFVVPAAAYLDALDAAGVRTAVAEDHRQARESGDADRARLCRRLADRVRAAGMPEGLPDAVRAAYGALSDPSGSGAPVVAVRSSAIGEDAEDTSFAGMNATFTGVHGAEEVLARVVDCWASLYGERAVAYRASRGVDTEPAIAVVVQVMIAADRAGVAFTADPRTGDRTDGDRRGRLRAGRGGGQRRRRTRHLRARHRRPRRSPAAVGTHRPAGPRDRRRPRRPGPHPVPRRRAGGGPGPHDDRDRAGGRGRGRRRRALRPPAGRGMGLRRRPPLARAGPSGHHRGSAGRSVPRGRAAARHPRLAGPGDRIGAGCSDSRPRGSGWWAARSSWPR